MTETVLWGILLVVVAGIVNGTWVLPMKYVTDWKWENIWLVYSVFGMIIVPWLVAVLTVPRLFLLYQSSTAKTLSTALLCGIGWGVGSILYGQAVKMAGMALTFAIVLGLTSAIGSLLPLILLTPDEIWSPAAQAIILGVALSVIGILLCAISGRIPSSSSNEPPKNQVSVSTFTLGLLACIGSGVLSPLLNVSFAFGGEIMSGAIANGASPAAAPNAIWPLPLASGFVVNAGYCIYLLKKERSWNKYYFNRRATNWFLGAVMGLLWAGAYVIYGAGGSRMGSLTASVSWPIAIAVAIVTANIWGWVTGEWKDKTRSASALMIGGIILLVAAVFVIALGSR